MRTVREAEARQRRHNDVKGVKRVAASALRIGQKRDDLVETVEGIRPAVDQQERRGVGSFAPHVEKVDTASVDIRTKLCKLVELCLLSTPVVGVLPVIHQFLQVAQICAIVPTGILRLIRPTGPCQTLTQIIEGGL